MLITTLWCLRRRDSPEDSEEDLRSSFSSASPAQEILRAPSASWLSLQKLRQLPRPISLSLQQGKDSEHATPERPLRRHRRHEPAPRGLASTSWLMALCQLSSSFCAAADIFDQNCQVKQFSLRKRCWSSAAACRATLAPQSGHCCR